ncbi:type I pullulanase [Lachnoclostridium phytofermentans]|uniref:pullulanase n=1 Tax=Lachnoclostridium phytofermentans (strain ATCC 700394 / DSM 18823 / ISDg) TaxID=357809 RepID=A9KKT3_LACP7|nr:type I pullulanase [Lachnoclostridium phytofermentans]ABX42665.1 pullulanase, type I [Lachnoclostridium phytofermentans ISDg]
MRRIIVGMLVVALLLSMIGVQTKNAKGATDTITIHYHRDDGDYEKWNLWLWAEGKDGAAYYFDGEDAFGPYVSVSLDKSADRIGFIVRTDSWEKDVSEDRFIDTSLGDEIWISSGESTFSYEAPEGYEKEVSIESFQLKLNYLRYDEEYTDISFRLTFEDGTTDFLTKEHMRIENGILKAEKEVKYGKKITLDVLKNGLEEDYQGVSFSTAKIDEESKLEMYWMQGTGTISPKADFIKRSKEIESALITSMKEITVKLSVPCRVDDIKQDGFKLSPKLAVSKVEATSTRDSEYKTIKEGYADTFIITMEEPLDMSKKYALSKTDYGSRNLTLDSGLYTSEEFEAAYTYEGNDLGATYSKEKTVFKVWSPSAESISVLFYPHGEAKDGEKPEITYPMKQTGAGVWQAEIEGDLKNKYYVYQVTVDGKTKLVVDPYAKAAGVNGERGMVIDLSETDPDGFREHSSPEFKNPVDAVIYEIHVRDLSMNENSGIENKGKFLGFTETGTTNSAGLSTGLDHMKELGVTHVHLLPSFDYKTIDESKLGENKFNWGYDPQNYNLPEGSYTTDPYQGEVRVREYKEMVQALHENGLHVVMDVVYNHTYTAGDSNFTSLVPGYYYRTDINGNFTNGSGCGNETASERAMVRKFIVDSVVYWATEYKVDGFRFDLMGLHDIETMNMVREALDKIDPSILLYGEGWTGGSTPLPDSKQAIKNNAVELNERIACFSDDIRDAIKGSVFDASDTGFINSGKRNVSNRDESIKFGIVASVSHPQVNLSGVPYSSRFWANEPSQTINYASAHDNLTLWDKLLETNKMASKEELVQMNKLSAAIVLTSQGIPFFQAGEEMARTKKGNDNSYQSPDSINMLNWDNKTEYKDLFEYYKGLIALRKTYDAFRMQTAEEIQQKLEFVDSDSSVIAYRIHDAVKDGREIALIFNGTLEEKEVVLSANAWDVLVNQDTAGTDVIETITGGTIKVPAKSTLVLLENKDAVIKGDKDAVKGDEIQELPTNMQEVAEKESGNAWLWVGIATVCVLAGGVLFWILKRKR